MATIEDYQFVDDHVEYNMVIDAGGRIVGRTRKRYTAFRELHQTIMGELSLPRRFPMPKALFNTKSVYDARVKGLAKFINDALGRASQSGNPIPPPLQAFLELSRTSAVVSGQADDGDGFGDDA